jgi:hypothetical protein
MEKASFDDLLQAFQSALADAQEGLRLRAEGKGADEGQASALTFAVPRAGSGDGQDELLTLPVSSFRHQRRPHISLLSYAFECALEEERFPGMERVFRVVIGPEDTLLHRKKTRRTMQVIFHGSDSPCGEVRLDGDVLMRLPEHVEAGDDRDVSKAKPSLLARAAKLIRSLWPQHGYAMTVEQSLRVRQILAHSAQRK